MAEFRSAFAPLFQSFIHYRKASGRWNSSSYEPFLILFDRFCASNYPEDKELTQEMADSWCRQREGEMNNSCRPRIYVVVSFVRYLRKRGLPSLRPGSPEEGKEDIFLMLLPLESWNGFP